MRMRTTAGSGPAGGDGPADGSPADGTGADGTGADAAAARGTRRGLAGRPPMPRGGTG